MKRDLWVLHAKGILDWTSDLEDFCNSHSSNNYAYNIYLIMCKLIGWSQYIPYISNESLLGTTKDMED